MTQFSEEFIQWIRRAWKQMVLRSGVITIGAIILLVLGLALGWRAHTRGRFARLKAELRQSSTPPAMSSPRPGGQEPVILERSPIEAGTVPEFTSATILPGRGMNVLQITAVLPGKGKVNLLASPTLEEAGQQMTGTDSDKGGALSLAMGGAVEAPWAGELFGTPTQGGLSTHWNDHIVRLPAARQESGKAWAEGGLLLASQGTEVKSNVMPDGGEAEAVYTIGDPGGVWPSRTKIKTTVQLSGRTLTMKIAATNIGDTPEPVGLGWCPRFAILSHHREAMRLRLPSVTREERSSPRAGLPTGRLISVEGTPQDFSSIEGRQLGKSSLEGTFVNLRQAPLDSGPVAELWDSENKFGLRITMLSAAIKAVRASAPAGERFIVLEPRFNYDDPFGEEWAKEDKAGMVTLQPGSSIQWSIRLEIYGPAKPSAA
jgi:galactose mutarotase-like enzyme